jgi:hypothetical protein
MSERHWWYLFQEEVKSWDSTTWFRMCQFQTLAKKRHLQRHLLTELSAFLGVMIGVFWKRESRPIEWHHCPLLYHANFFSFFTSIVHGSSIMQTRREGSHTFCCSSANVLCSPRGHTTRPRSVLRDTLHHLSSFGLGLLLEIDSAVDDPRVHSILWITLKACLMCDLSDPVPI